MAKKSKWGSFIGAPSALDDGGLGTAFSDMGDMSRKSVQGLHYIDHLPEYAVADVTYGYGSSISGQAEYTSPGTYSWTCPAGVTKVAVVAVGGGAAGASSGNRGGGGGGPDARGSGGRAMVHPEGPEPAHPGRAAPVRRGVRGYG